MNTTILVTGGTGTLGSLVVPKLRDAGRDVRILSRKGAEGRQALPGITYVRGDLATGEGVADALRGVGTVLHLAGSAKGDEVKARNLVEAARAAGGTPHLVYISVVGCDRLPVVSRTDRAMYGYFADKREAERILAGSGLPWTTLRATQFHDFVLTFLAAMAKLPVVPVPAGVRFQSVDAAEVAERLVALALGEPAGLVADAGGPQALGAREMLADYLRVTGKRRLVLPVRMPGKASRAYREGANLTPGHAAGGRTWEEFLAETAHRGPVRNGGGARRADARERRSAA